MTNGPAGAELVDLVQRGRHLPIDVGHEIHAAQPEKFLRAVHGFLDT